MKQIKTLVAVLLTMICMSSYATDVIPKKKSVVKTGAPFKVLQVSICTNSVTGVGGIPICLAASCYTITYQVTNGVLIHNVSYTSTSGTCGGGSVQVYLRNTGDPAADQILLDKLIKDVICQEENPASETQCTFQ